MNRIMKSMNKIALIFVGIVFFGSTANAWNDPSNSGAIKPTNLARFQVERSHQVQTDRETVNSMLELLQAVETNDLDNAMTMIVDNPLVTGLFPVDKFGMHYQSGTTFLK